tara:strand:+ start:11119 stop:14709 length:3591 start_codon:yes stop_codon:yes gene_type:complete
MESLGSFQNELLSTDNIMTSTRLPRYITFKNNIDIAENSKRRLRKIFGLNFKGIKGVKAQNKIVMDYAKELRGTGKRFRSIRYAYKFLAQDYNAGVEQQREKILKARKIRKEFEKRLIKFKLSKTGKLCIQKETLDVLGIEQVIRIIMEFLAGEMVLLYAKGVEIEGDGDVNESEKYYTLTQGNLERLINALKAVQEEEEVVVDESDIQYAYVLSETTELCIEFIDFVEDDLDASGKVKTKKGGAFFKYLNKTKFDLSRYGVYPEVVPDNYKDNCLYKALQNGGMNKDKLNLLTSFVVNRDVPMSKLKKVCEKLHIQIRLRKKDRSDKAIIYGKGHNECYEIGLVDRHYFLIEKCDFTMFALKNYWELINTDWEVDEIKYFYKRRKNSFSSDEKRKTDSFKVMNFLFENKEEYLMPISFDKGILETQFVDRAFDFDNLEYDEEECSKVNEYDAEKEDYKVSRGKEWKKWYFDTESYKQKYKNNKIEAEIQELIDNPKKGNKAKIDELKKKLYSYIHIPYMACAVSDRGEKITAYGDGCCKLMLEAIVKHTEERESGYETGEYNIQMGCIDKVCKKALLIAHNCNYDYRFFQKYLYCIDQKTKGSGLMNATARYMSFKQKKTEVRLQFKDSLKLIAMPLRKFGKCFGLKQEKEVFPYGLYNRKNLLDNWVDVKKARKYLTEEKFVMMKKNLKRLKLVKTIDGKKLFNMMKYAEYYCMMDCKVLKAGYETFRGWVLNQIDIDIDGVWTIASLADKYMKKNGVYDGVYQLAGVPQLFIQKCVVGGRTMCRDNVKWRFDSIKNKQHKGKKMADYDGVSLYPSSMYRMEGCLKGLPKIIEKNNLNYDFLKSVDGYFVKIKITEVGINRHFSLMSEVNENGVRVFHNDMEDKIMYVDKTTLEDMINFQEVKFDVLCGYYYDEGRNPLIREVIKRVFDLRLKLKKEKNEAQLVYKLIMNSAYGKTILKPINTEEAIVSEKEKDTFIKKNYNYIMEYEKMWGSKNWRFKLHKTINEHFNNCCVGVEVLSMSKRIMNEVMCLCEDYNLTAYYQDTDSIHMVWDDVAVLKKKYKEIYGRELDGKQLGQFHIDFDLEDDNGNECDNVYAEKSIFLGKKCYIDCLVGTNPDGKICRGHHIRMKGVPNSTIKYTAKKMNIGLDELYERLFYGEKITFDLLEGGNRCNFKFHNNGSVSSMVDFKRAICFK